MGQHFFDRRVRGEAVERAEDVGFSVFDELVRPADALDGRVDAGGMKVLDDAGAEAVEQDVVLEGAEDAALCRRIPRAPRCPSA